VRRSDGKPFALKCSMRATILDGITDEGSAGRPSRSADHLSDDAETYASGTECFAAELHMLASPKLIHPNLIRCYGHGFRKLHDGRVQSFVALELCSGMDLRVKMRRGGIDNPRVERWALELATALAHLHSVGVVHRDVKASNIIIQDDEKLKLIDLGLAFWLPPGEQDFTELVTDFQISQRVGVPGYMPPEVFNCKPYGTAVDVFAYGALLHRLLWHALPPPSDIRCNAWVKDMLYSLAPCAYVTLVCTLGISPAWPPHLASIVRAASAISPEERPTAATIVQQLRSSGVDTSAVVAGEMTRR